MDGVATRVHAFHAEMDDLVTRSHVKMFAEINNMVIGSHDITDKLSGERSSRKDIC